MPTYMPNIQYAKSYVFAYVNCCIYYRARISMPVNMLSSIYLLICQILWVPPCIETTVDLCYNKSSICFGYMLYDYMPVAICQISHDSYSILAFICRHMSAKYLLWDAKLAYMSNCYLSVNMPSALFQELYAECYGLYAKLHMLDWNMPNAMTIAMSFSMTTEQVGYFVIYISIIWLWLSILPLQEEITIIPPGLQFISQVSCISVW
jgi:hypothetical protein